MSGQTAGSPPRVLVAGGGVAALEVVLALRERDGGTIRPTLLTDAERFDHRPRTAYPGLVADDGQPVELVAFAAEQGADRIRGRLADVDAQAGVAVTADGDRVGFDALVIATGATPREGLPGAITLGAPDDERAFAAMVARVRSGAAGRIAVVVPPGVAWSLPAYELALLLDHASVPGPTMIAVVTSEVRPMAVAGEEFSDAIAALLRRRGIDLTTSTWPDAVDDGMLWMPLQGAVEVDEVVALARPHGPGYPSLPHDDRGFLPVDAHGLVQGTRRVWAAGDVAVHAVKQGGFAIQQADAVAQDVARTLAGSPRGPGVAAPVLRAALRHGDGTLFLRAEHVDGTIRTEVSDEPLWWPPEQIAGGRLPSWLATYAAGTAPSPSGR